MKKSSTNLLLVLKGYVRKKRVLARGQNTILVKALKPTKIAD